MDAEKADFDTLIRNLGRPWPRPGVEQRLALAVSLLLASGVLLAWRLGDWQFLSLAGTLIVVLGIETARRDIVGTIDHVRGDFHSEFRRMAGELDRSSPAGALRAARVQILRERTEATGDRIDEALRIARARAVNVEALVLMLGTLVSGAAWLAHTLV